MVSRIHSGWMDWITPNKPCNIPMRVSQVTSKPDLYPLVITCGNEGDNKSATGGNYLMVHYFRNYVIRAPGKYGGYGYGIQHHQAKCIRPLMGKS